ncbi:MAG: SkfA peptide export ATP-binding protein SkfE [Phycisphaerae bacterium]|nr:SkfA peptide export ATP-binding protein SkfE [Phycisphaerae bacterium]
MNVNIIELQEVMKSYGAKLAVDRLSLEVRRGEIFAFLGPNGAGKTTTIKLIAGLLQADHGQLRISGQDVSRDGLAVRSRMAYVPDQPFVYEKLTGREFLEFVREMYRVPAEVARERIAVFARQLDMGSYLDQLCESYSHGMKQKVVLAAALLHDPELLVIDEPMVGLDPRTVRVVKNLFVERARSGRTVFMSTHTLAIAEAVADRIGIIHQGRLVTVGTFAELQAMQMQSSLEEIFLQLTAEPRDEQI